MICRLYSWTEGNFMIITLQQLFQHWLSVMWTSAFHVLSTTIDFVFCKSGIQLFLHCQDTASYQNLVSGKLCPIRCSKDVQHCTLPSEPSRPLQKSPKVWSSLKSNTVKHRVRELECLECHCCQQHQHTQGRESTWCQIFGYALNAQLDLREWIASVGQHELYAHKEMSSTF